MDMLLLVTSLEEYLVPVTAWNDPEELLEDVNWDISDRTAFNPPLPRSFYPNCRSLFKLGRLTFKMARWKCLRVAGIFRHKLSDGYTSENVERCRHWKQQRWLYKARDDFKNKAETPWRTIGSSMWVLFDISVFFNQHGFLMLLSRSTSATGE